MPDGLGRIKALLDAAAGGELELGDPVAGYLPDARACRDGRVTIAHLLTNTSGLPDSRGSYRWCGSPAELLRDLHQTPLDEPPGSRAAYSDLGFMFLGEVVAAVAGEPLDAAVRRLVTGPPGTVRRLVGELRLRLGLPGRRLRHPGRPLAGP